MTTDQPDRERAEEFVPDAARAPVAVGTCCCSKAKADCPYHGEHPTAHDTYAEHCREHVPGTPTHGGGRCDLCELTSPDTRSEVEAVEEAEEQHEFDDRYAQWEHENREARSEVAALLAHWHEDVETLARLWARFEQVGDVWDELHPADQQHRLDCARRVLAAGYVSPARHDADIAAVAATWQATLDKTVDEANRQLAGAKAAGAANGLEAGVRQAIEWLRADYPYGDGPDWREHGCEWIADRLAEHTAAALTTGGEA